MANLDPRYEYFETRFEFCTKNPNYECYWKVVKGINMAEKVKKRIKSVTKESPKSKKPYFGQDMAFLGVKWSQNQIMGWKIHLKLVFNHTFFIEKNFKVDVLDSKSNRTILLGSVSYRKKRFFTFPAMLMPVTTFQ